MFHPCFFRLMVLLTIPLFLLSGPVFGSGNQKLKVKVAVEGFGFVDSDPVGISCPGKCGKKFLRDSKVQLQATPASAQEFIRWEGDCEGTDPICDIIVSKKTRVVAYFTAYTDSPDADAYPAPVAPTGQIMCWDEFGGSIACGGTGQDGDIQAGVVLPDPRFSDNGDGTVTDNLTGLVWLKDANCFGATVWSRPAPRGALQLVNALESGACDLTDGSVAGDWWLPNLRQLQSLIDYGNITPALPVDHPFFNVSTFYWTSTTDASAPTYAFTVSFYNGLIWDYSKSSPGTSVYVWPVRAANNSGDSDADGVADQFDNCTDHPNPAQLDTDGDNYGNACDPDFDNNGIVDASDYALLQSVFGSVTAPDQDLNGDGIVNNADVEILETFLGNPPGPSSLAL